MNRKGRRRQAANQRVQKPASDPAIVARAPAQSLNEQAQAKAAPLVRPGPVDVPPGWLRSDLPGVLWPAIQSGINAKALAIQFQLEQTQWWSPERLRAHQFKQLAELVRHAGIAVPYYRKLFKEVGFDPRAPLDEVSWAHLPILTRRDIQDCLAELQSEHVPPGHGDTGVSDTSGSTGVEISVSKTRLQQLLWECVSRRDHLWHRRDLSGSHANIGALRRIGEAPYPDGKRQLSWGPTVGPYRTGPSHLLEITTSIEHQAEWLARVKPNCLNTYPSNLDALAHHCRDTGLTLPSLRTLRTNSEILRPETRALCRAVFGLEIADMYSSAEVGYIALQSPESEELLVQAEATLVEVLDDEGRPCAPGQIGRVIVTPLHAFAMPLLRYASGDLAEVGGPAACGRGLPVLARVLGRERQMMRLPTGERFWPVFWDLWNPFPEIRQFQIVHKTATLIELRLAVRTPLDAAKEARLRHDLIERLRYPFDIRFTYLDTIPREPNGKFFDIKSEIA